MTSWNVLGYAPHAQLNHPVEGANYSFLAQPEHRVTAPQDEEVEKVYAEQFLSE